MAPPTPARLCPQCRDRTEQRLCPRDGSATLALGTPTDDQSFRPGMVVAERYRLVRELGHGGHGIVFEAEHLFGLGRVALKLLRGGEGLEVDLLRFHREARITAALVHPNTVRVLDFGQTDGGSSFLVLELLHGHTLETELRERQRQGRRFSEAEALALAEDVLAGLQAAHAHGLVHRDLKPSNLLICQGPAGQVVKILDFGIAQVAGSDLTRSRHTLGTPAYMSPEQAQDGELDGRSDLYALGVILFRCVTGRLPFKASTDLAVMWAHVHKPVPDVASAAPVSPAFAEALASVLAKQPEDRPADADAMRRRLRGEEVPAPRPVATPVERPVVPTPVRSGTPTVEALPASRKAPGRGRALWLLGSAVLLLIALGRMAAGADPAVAPAANAHTGSSAGGDSPPRPAKPEARPASTPTSTAAPAPTSASAPTSAPAVAPAPAPVVPAPAPPSPRPVKKKAGKKAQPAPYRFGAEDLPP